ncbi:MAG: DUF4440 domain-containing protein [Blastopirellula sp.]|nr:MAG: DUF4440 domain-containing protein [Blastopirellula sp.]
MSRTPFRLACFAFLCLATTLSADQAEDKGLIEKAVASYTAAFNKGDAKALAEHWGANAIYINPLTGTQVEGRAAIEKEFSEIMADLKGSKLEVEVLSIQFISPSVAVENGTAKLLRPDERISESTYSAVHIKSNGKWALDRVTEEEVPVIQSNYEHLKSLEWLVGTWVDEDAQMRIETTCKWTKNKNFITRIFTTTLGNKDGTTGLQVIGWDASEKQIRSWVFDSDGGFAEATWMNKGDRWYITTKGTLADGGKASFINIITKVDDDQFHWQSVNRTIDGNLAPNIDEVVVIRSASAE